MLKIIRLDEDTFVAIEDAEGSKALLLGPVALVTVPTHIDNLLKIVEVKSGASIVV